MFALASFHFFFYFNCAPNKKWLNTGSSQSMRANQVVFLLRQKSNVPRMQKRLKEIEHSDLKLNKFRLFFVLTKTLRYKEAKKLMLPVVVRRLKNPSVVVVVVGNKTVV
jgi:hypothetical protein